MPQQMVDFWVSGAEVPRVSDYERGLVYKWVFPECLGHPFTRPLTPGRFMRRLGRVLRRYPGDRHMTNLQRENLMHLVGIVLSRLRAAPEHWPG